MELQYLADELMPNIQTIGSSFNSSKGAQGEYSRNPRIARTIDGILRGSHDSISINKEQEKFLEDLLIAIQKGKYLEFEEKYGISYNVALDIIIRMGHNHIFLYGPPGVGKTTLGKELAKKLGTNAIDTDERIEQENKGKTIADIVKVDGIDRFRQIEFDILSKVLMEARGKHIISLGGGTLLSSYSLKAAQLHGTIIGITADTNTLAERALARPGQRPLINTSTSSETHQSLSSLLTTREGHYGQFGNHFDSSKQSPNAIVSRIAKMF